MKLKTKDLLTGDEITSKEFLKLIDFSIKLKKQNKTGKEKPLLIIIFKNMNILLKKIKIIYAFH